MAFEASWLDLREPVDHASRDPELLAAAASHLARNPVAVDLGAGTGSTVRAFGTKVTGSQWRLVDADAGLLALASKRNGEAQTHLLDLADPDKLPLDGAGLVTASALLDLMPRDWCERLADLLVSRGIGFYAALNYDGKMHWEPALIEDPLVAKSFNQHQRGDKGNGPALGPDAGQVVAEIFAERGYVVRTADSPWQLGPGDAELQRQLVAGIAKAAAETGSIFAENWGHARLAACGSTNCTIGHVDVLALPS